jgi:hypothetical protein
MWHNSSLMRVCVYILACILSFNHFMMIKLVQYENIKIDESCIVGNTIYYGI